jgi:hypothetical protein
MPNMSYCRFQNTLNDLRDCADAVADMMDQEHLVRHYKMVKAKRDMLINRPELLTEDEQMLMDEANEEMDRIKDLLDPLSRDEYTAALQLLELCAELSEAYCDADLISEDSL